MKERIEELARKVGAYDVDRGICIVGEIELAKFYNEALELAAQECDNRKDSWIEFGYKHDDERVAEAFRCAAAIRKLKV